MNTQSVQIGGTSLRKRLASLALELPEFREQLGQVATDVRDTATDPDATEATIEGHFESALYSVLREVGIRFVPTKEAALETRRHVGKGRADARLGALVIEYKKPAALSTATQRLSAAAQLHEYVTGVSAKEGGALSRGFLTDGLVLAELTSEDPEPEDDSEIVFRQLTADGLFRITSEIVALDLTALTSRNLVRDFAGNDHAGVIFDAARCLRHALIEAPAPKTEMLYAEWEALFRLAHDDESQQRRIEERRAALGMVYGVELSDPEAEYTALFSLHTAYAIVVKLIAYRVTAVLRYGEPPSSFRSLLSGNASSLRLFCQFLEDGDIFRQLGILNLLEGDFFSWYCGSQQWNSQIAASIRSILETLARYENTASVFTHEGARDLFRELYESVVPRAVRSSFGEFYTPPWLAQHVLETAIEGVDEWRMLDPCCGSGTFLTEAIARIRAECDGEPPSDVLDAILRRAVGIDLNPLAVLTARIQYFIRIADLLPDNPPPLTIPVFLGDASNPPDITSIDSVQCVRYMLSTIADPIEATLPVSLVRDATTLFGVVTEYEQLIGRGHSNRAANLLLENVPERDRTEAIRANIHSLSRQLVELEKRGWNGIWARILSNFLTTACLGQFSTIVGNPPWIDWKNLPENYRERIKGLAIDRGLFSGAGRTGGINLNICALICYVSCQNWLAPGGVLAFLMPRELAYQASYEGWRRLGEDDNLHFREFHDWGRAGYPFDPVREDFMTYVVARDGTESSRIPVQSHVLRGSPRTDAARWQSRLQADEALMTHRRVAGRLDSASTRFTFADNETELSHMASVAGTAEYLGREGIEFYPNELLLWKYDAPGPQDGLVWVRNIQTPKAKYRIPSTRILVETAYLHPLVRGPMIRPFALAGEDILVAFPYSGDNPQRPIEPDELANTSPRLLDFYERNREIIERQTKFSDKIRGQGEFYGLARTGAYSFADVHVAFRDNTKWRACVATGKVMPWGEYRRYLFQNHAVSISERLDGSSITEDEAHYICSVLNAPTVEKYIMASSDDRSFKVRPPVRIPLFDESDVDHRRLALIGREITSKEVPFESMAGELDRLCLRLRG